MENLSIGKDDSEEKLLKLAVAADKFEGYTHSHAERIAEIADALAQKFSFAAHDRLSLRQAALVHDIGELVMNRDYIRSGQTLRDDERVDMERHPVIGEQEAAKYGLNRAVQLLARWHHEWWNGTGYPDALAQKQIPLAARILRVADTFASLTNARPHRVQISEQEAKRYLVEWSGIEFDPKVVKMFLSLEELPESESYFT